MEIPGHGHRLLDRAMVCPTDDHSISLDYPAPDPDHRRCSNDGDAWITMGETGAAQFGGHK